MPQYSCEWENQIEEDLNETGKKGYFSQQCSIFPTKVLPPSTITMPLVLPNRIFIKHKHPL